ncbi:MAG TPA: N-carbamoyl-D-amino-acid hydrolase [Alphaproteobacteria bacterium]|nr:N-carbamoyl-D-amino-acid hydrolase [Alphaproteobacteria bacterium]
MSRKLMLGAAQLGPIRRDESRQAVVARLLALLRQAHARGCRLVVYPEMALTTFFPRWYMTDQAEVDAFFEREMPNAATRPLFEEAKRLGIGFCLGYAELVEEKGAIRHYNTAILVDAEGKLVGKYRKIHLPGHAEYEPQRPFQHLEKRYYDVGDLGWPVWRAFGGIVGMCICNDRRWPETYRVMGLQGVELVMLGFNTPEYNAAFREPAHHRLMHHYLSVQSGAYQNGTWVVAVAKAGLEEGCMLMGGTCVVAPSGELVAVASTLEDELLAYEIDLDATTPIKETVFNFAKHRRPEHYRLIVERIGAVPPPR